jgi:hypothetical protein
LLDTRRVKARLWPRRFHALGFGARGRLAERILPLLGSHPVGARNLARGRRQGFAHGRRRPAIALFAPGLGHLRDDLRVAPAGRVVATAVVTTAIE